MMATDYKDRFYSEYYATHIKDRKGKPGISEFASRSKTYKKQFGEFLPDSRDVRILDVGCGNGSVLWWLQRLGYVNSFGIDLNREQIQIGSALGVKNLEQGDWREFLKNNEGKYGVIFLRDILEHFNKSAAVALVEACHRALKDKGLLIVQVPNAESPFFGRVRYGDFTHELAFTASSLSQLLKICGFQRVLIRPIAPVISGVRSFMRFVLWAIISGVYKFVLFVESGTSRKYVTQNIFAVASK